MTSVTTSPVPSGCSTSPANSHWVYFPSPLTLRQSPNGTDRRKRSHFAPTDGAHCHSPCSQRRRHADNENVSRQFQSTLLRRIGGSAVCSRCEQPHRQPPDATPPADGSPDANGCLSRHVFSRQSHHTQYCCALNRTGVTGTGDRARRISGSRADQ